MTTTNAARSQDPAQTAYSAPRWHHWAYVSNLVLQIAIVATGGTVRLTESGLGCTTAPECVPGSIVPLADQNEGIHTAIEFGNRMVSVFVGIVALIALIAAWRSARKALRGWAIVALMGVPAQAVLGAITVRVGLNPASVAAHFLLSMVLVTASAALLTRSTEPDGPARRTVPSLAWKAGLTSAGILVVLLLLGTITTGTGPHSGDSEMLDRFSFNLTTVTRMHALVGIAFTIAVVVWWYSLRKVVTAKIAAAKPEPAAIAHLAGAQRDLTRVNWLLGAVVLQVAIGYAQYLTGLPIILVGLHMLGAAILTAATTWAVMGLRTRS